MSNKTQPKADVIHVQSTRDKDKARCGKRAGGHQRVTKIMAIVTCTDCRPTLPETRDITGIHAVAHGSM